MAVGLKKGHTYAQIEKKSLIMAGTHSFFPQKPSAHWQNFFAWPSGGRGNWDLNCPWMQTPCLLMQGICTLQLPTCEGAHECEQVSSPKATIGRMFEWCLSAAVVKPSLKPMTPWKITKASCHLPRICHAFATHLPPALGGWRDMWDLAGQVVATLRAERSHPGGITTPEGMCFHMLMQMMQGQLGWNHTTSLQ